MSNNNRNKWLPTTLISVGSILLLVFLWWAWHGTITLLGRGIWTNAVPKILVGLLVLSGIIYLIDYYRQRKVLKRIADERGEESWRAQRRSSYYYDSEYREPSTFFVTGLIVTSVLGLLTICLGLSPAHYQTYSGLYSSVTIAEDQQAEYDWRLPWTIAAKAASNRAGNVDGTFDSDATTYLPGTHEYSVPVQAKGFITGYSEVVVYSLEDQTSTSCAFKAEVPTASGGKFAYNLRRAISFVDLGITYSSDDGWGYCDGEDAKFVMPVSMLDGQLQSHVVPAGVVIFDGINTEWRQNVNPGELPGPVYPESVAQAQRISTQTEDGWWSWLFNKVGYEETGSNDDDPNGNNATELLLNRKGNSQDQYDYVTPLTARGTSTSITAVSQVAANQVKFGELNPLTVNILPQTREGNSALADRIKSAFPELGWATGLALVEVLPTSQNTWIGTLANDRTATQRIEVTATGDVCLQTLTGKKVRCIKEDGSDQEPASEAGKTKQLNQYSNKELLTLLRELTDELNRRESHAMQQ